MKKNTTYLLAGIALFGAYWYYSQKDKQQPIILPNPQQLPGTSAGGGNKWVTLGNELGQIVQVLVNSVGQIVQAFKPNGNPASNTDILNILQSSNPQIIDTGGGSSTYDYGLGGIKRIGGGGVH